MLVGMGHCQGGGADSFGQASQSPTSLQSAVFDKQHDAILALQDWRENDNKPNYLISARYKNGNESLGVEYTRKLCQYPEVRLRLRTARSSFHTTFR